MLKRTLKKLLLFAVFLLVVWLAVIFYWKMTHRLPDGTDVFLYFVLLPLGMLLTYGVLKKSIDGVKHLMKLGGGAVAGAAVTMTNAASAQTHNHDALERLFKLELIATAVCLPEADSSSALLDLLAEPKFEAKPSATLKNSAGYPVLCTEVQGVSIEALREELSPLAALQSPSHEWWDSCLRSATLIEPVLQNLVKMAQQQLPDPTIDQTTLGLRIHALLPEAWPDSQREWMARWLKKIVLGAVWPESNLTISVQPCGARLECVSVLDQWNVSLNREQLNDLCLLVAVDSAIDATIVRDWEQRSLLFSPAHPKAIVPGEGAAGVLVKRGEKQPATTEGAPRIVLHRAATGRRAESVDAGAKPSGHLLQELAQHALRAANVEISNLSGIIADTDHRSYRFTEVVRAGNALGQIKKEDDLVVGSPGQSMGYAGAATTLAALAACREHAANEKKAVLWCLAQDGFERAAVVVNTMHP